MTVLAKTRTGRIIFSGLRGATGLKGDPGSGGNTYSTIIALQNAGNTASNLDSAYLTAAGRSGKFIYTTANISAQVTSDTLQGIYIAKASTPTGASGGWVRDWDGINGQPEWFGATTASVGFDNRAAFNAAELLCPVINFKSADYYIQGRWEPKTGYRAWRGPFKPDGYNTAHGTRIISTITSADVCRVGPATLPVSTDGFLRSVEMTNLCFMHVGARVLPTPGNEKSAVCGLRAEYLINSKICDNYANEPIIGFVFLGVVGCHVDRNWSFRSELFGGNDIFIGMLLTGVALTAYGLIGNNASIYGREWNSTCAGAALGLTAAKRIGMWFDGAISDGFNYDPETLGCGILVTGMGAADTSVWNGDFKIVSAVVDQYDGYSYDISGINKKGCIRLIDPYAGAPNTATYAVRFRSCAGAVMMIGGDLYCGTNNDTVGVNIENCTGLTVVRDTVIHEFGRPMSVVTSKNFDVSPNIVCHANTPTISQGAVSLTNSQRGSVKVAIDGKAACYPQAIVTFDALCDKIVMDASRVDATMIAGGAGNKVVINSAVALTTPGYYTAAGAAGTTGQGLNLVGITI